MTNQIDDAGHAILGGMIEDLGLQIHCNARVTEFLGDDKVAGLNFSNEGWEDLDVGMVVVSAGIRYVSYLVDSIFHNRQQTSMPGESVLREVCCGSTI